MRPSSCLHRNLGVHLGLGPMPRDPRCDDVCLTHVIPSKPRTVTSSKMPLPIIVTPTYPNIPPPHYNSITCLGAFQYLLLGGKGVTGGIIFRGAQCYRKRLCVALGIKGIPWGPPLNPKPYIFPPQVDRIWGNGDLITIYPKPYSIYSRRTINPT